MTARSFGDVGEGRERAEAQGAVGVDPDAALDAAQPEQHLRRELAPLHVRVQVGSAGDGHGVGPEVGAAAAPLPWRCGARDSGTAAASASRGQGRSAGSTSGRVAGAAVSSGGTITVSG